MENNWEGVKQKKTSQLTKELEFFISKLDKIRSNQISLESISNLMVNLQGEKKPLKAVASSRISSNHELIIKAFEVKSIPAISKTILDNQLGYKLERSTKEEAIFTLTPITKEIKERLIKEVKLVAEEGKKSFRLIHQDLKKALKEDRSLSQDQKKNCEKQTDKLIKDYQDKFLIAEEKKIKSLSS
ncbi:MAG: Ribosome-recycling factor [Mycoplasmataceae bacterium]|nr:MAG: Ribosome-recycling factor [Mycoplasmataceae bacterium]